MPSNGNLKDSTCMARLNSVWHGHFSLSKKRQIVTLHFSLLFTQLCVKRTRICKQMTHGPAALSCVMRETERTAATEEQQDNIIT